MRLLLTLVSCAALATACSGGGDIPRLGGAAIEVGENGVLLLRIDEFTDGGYGTSGIGRLPDRIVHETWMQVVDGEIVDSIYRLSAVNGEVFDVRSGSDTGALPPLDAFRLEQVERDTQRDIDSGAAHLEIGSGGLDVVVYPRGRGCSRSQERPEGDYEERAEVFAGTLQPVGTSNCIVRLPDGEVRVLDSSVMTTEALLASAWPSIVATLEEWRVAHD